MRGAEAQGFCPGEPAPGPALCRAPPHRAQAAPGARLAPAAWGGLEAAMGLFIAVHVGAGVHARGRHAAYKAGAAPASTALTPLPITAVLSFFWAVFRELCLRKTASCNGTQ